MQRGAFIGLGKLVGYLLLPCVFYSIPTWWLEAHPVPCLNRLLFKRQCPGCGMTRALSYAAHGHFQRSLYHNKLVVAVLPLGILAWFQGLCSAYRDFRKYLT